MEHAPNNQSFLRGRTWTLTLALILVFSAVLFVIKIRENPPGFYVDESSIAYNAHVIAQTGKDEHGETLPLFFRAFGEYKNPIYIYLLAAVFRFTGPSILAARLLSAFLIYAAALLTGWLAFRISRRREIGLIILVMALFTPWLFELSRVVLEVAIYPLLLAVFFLNLRRVSGKTNWSWADAGSIAVTLALLTYSYSIGRLFAPLLALGFLIFLPRFKWSSVGRVWLLYGLLLLPLLIFHWHHPGALTERFHVISYAGRESSYASLAWEFVKHYVGNYNPWRMVVRGDPNTRQVAAGAAPAGAGK